MITGKTVFEQEIEICDPEDDAVKAYSYYYKKHWTSVKHLKDESWCMKYYADNKEVTEPVPDDLMQDVLALETTGESIGGNPRE